MRRWALSLLGLAMFGCAAPAPSESEHVVEHGQPAPPPTRSELDALIDRLPPVGQERGRSGRWELAAATDEMRVKIEGGVSLTSEQWKRLLIRTGSLRFPDRWKPDRPIAVPMERTFVLLLTRVTMIPRASRLNTLVCGSTSSGGCGNCMESAREAWANQELGILPLGHHKLIFDVTIERGRPFFDKDSAPPAGIVWRGPMEFELDVGFFPSVRVARDSGDLAPIGAVGPYAFLARFPALAGVASDFGLVPPPTWYFVPRR